MCVWVCVCVFVWMCMFCEIYFTFLSLSVSLIIICRGVLHMIHWIMIDFFIFAVRFTFAFFGNVDNDDDNNEMHLKNKHNLTPEWPCIRLAFSSSFRTFLSLNNNHKFTLFHIHTHFIFWCCYILFFFITYLHLHLHLIGSGMLDSLFYFCARTTKLYAMFSVFVEWSVWFLFSFTLCVYVVTSSLALVYPYIAFSVLISTWAFSVFQSIGKLYNPCRYLQIK